MNKSQSILAIGITTLIALIIAAVYNRKSIVKYFKIKCKTKAITLHSQLPLTSELMDRFMPAVNTNDLNNPHNHEQN